MTGVSGRGSRPSSPTSSTGRWPGISTGPGWCRGAHDRIEGFDQIDKVIEIDQSPIGRTPRSNPATYTGLFTPIRELFTQLPEAKIARLRAGPLLLQREGGALRGVPGGRAGQDRNALPARRLRPLRGVQGAALQPGDARSALQGRSIADVLDLTVGGGTRLLREPSGASPTNWNC